jgi:nucleotide-binding universal stress UspA family protein
MAGRNRRSALHTPGQSERLGFRSLLVPVDFAPLTDRVVARVGCLPLRAGARVHLLHVVPAHLAGTLRQRATRDAERALSVLCTDLRAALPRGITVDRDVRVGAAAAQISDAAHRVGADLVVIGRGGGRGLRDAVLGSTAERVLRQTQTPVLAVRAAVRHAYRSPAIALDALQPRPEVIVPLLDTVGAPYPPITVLHAIDTPFSTLRYPNLTAGQLRGARAHAKRTATEALRIAMQEGVAHSHVAPQSAPLWKLVIRNGDTRSVIAQGVEQHHVDLLAVATRGRRGLAHAFLGTVAGDVLRRVRCDVLSVPPSGSR